MPNFVRDDRGMPLNHDEIKALRVECDKALQATDLEIRIEQCCFQDWLYRGDDDATKSMLEEISNIYGYAGYRAAVDEIMRKRNQPYIAA